jgi:hypothetical protein
MQQDEETCDVIPFWVTGMVIWATALGVTALTL